jgi:hypothetical protein
MSFSVKPTTQQLTKPPVPIADRSIAVPSALPKMTKDLPLYSLSILVFGALIIKSSKPSPFLIVGAWRFSGVNNKYVLPGKSYVIFGKTDGTAINLSAIASGTGGFGITGVDWDSHSHRR